MRERQSVVRAERARRNGAVDRIADAPAGAADLASSTDSAARAAASPAGDEAVA
jgi:hypothetical protein